jgi:hypothetical protein
MLQDTTLSSEGFPILLVRGIGDVLARQEATGATALEIYRSLSPEGAAGQSLETVTAYLEECRQRDYAKVAHGSNAWSFTEQGAKLHAEMTSFLRTLPEKMRSGEVVAT